MLVQGGLCRTCSETTLLVFPRGGYYDLFFSQCGNFTVGQEEMKHQMAEIHKLMQYVDPEFCSYLGKLCSFVKT